MLCVDKLDSIKAVMFCVDCDSELLKRNVNEVPVVECDNFLVQCQIFF